MQYKDYTYNELIQIVKKNKITKNTALIKKAYNLMKAYYKGQKRKSGKPFLSHLLNTAYILAELNLDEDSIIAGLTHDFLDDNIENKAILEKEINKTVTKIVEEIHSTDYIITKNIGHIDNETLANCILANTKDVRTLIIELVTGLENLRNIDYLSEAEKQKEATMLEEIYVPIAHKLGLYTLEWEMADICFKIKNPQAYYKIKEALNEKRKTREEIINRFIEKINKKLSEKGIYAIIYGRPKSFSGIYRKMQKQNKKLNEIMDLLGVRILCESVEDCYTILGIIHANFSLYPHHFDDYIANPKPNNYRSLHTVVETEGRNIEVQIRTYEMHHEAEEGKAAHWGYKKLKKNPYFDKQLTWAKQLVSWQQKNQGVLKNFNIELGHNKIFVFTPKKQVIMLPEKATPVDFAFALHTQLGLLCKKAIVNGTPVPLDYELKNADTVEIIKSTKPEVKKQWLTFVKTEKAKTKIRKKLGLPQKTPKEMKTKNVKKISHGNVILAKCCNPLPGDEVFGYRTTKRKITVHRSDCPNKRMLKKENILEIGWGEEKKGAYNAKISVSAFSDANLLEKILKTISNEEIPIKWSSSKHDKSNIMKTEFEIIVKSRAQFDHLLKNIEKIAGVFEVKRI